MTGTAEGDARVVAGAGGVVRIEGEVDIGNVADVERDLRGAIAGAGRASLDLSGLAYADSAFLRMLLDLGAECSARGGRLVATAAEGTFADELLRLSRLDTVLGPQEG